MLHCAVVALSQPMSLPKLTKTASASSRRLQIASGHFISKPALSGAKFMAGGDAAPSGAASMATSATASGAGASAAAPTLASTSAALSRLENVPNARDLASASPSRIAPGRLFRSGNPAHGTPADVKTLRLDLGLRSMLDFRSSEEHAEDTGWSLMLSNGEATTYDAAGAVTSISFDHAAELAGLELPTCALHRLSLLEKDRFIRALLWRLPPWRVAQAVAFKALGDQGRMRDVLVPEINRQGLPLVYKILLDSAAPDIRRCLELMAAGAAARRPQLLFCRLGKDRTGLVSALVLAAAGASDAEIVADYAASDGVDSVALGGVEKMEETQGMDRALFASAPPEAMEEVLSYARERYGGMRQYMAGVGFGMGQQAALAAALSPETPW